MADHDDGGVTLSELLICIAIMGIIAAALSASTIAVLRNEGPTRDRLTEANGALFLSSYLPRDAASADTINAGSPGSNCPNAPAGGSVANQLTLSWDETVDGATTSFES